MYLTYDLEQKTNGRQKALYHKVKRVYIAGNVKDWRTGLVRKKTGREVYGLRVEYEQTRKGYRRRGYAVRRAEMKYLVAPRTVAATAQRFVQVVEVPTAARNVHFYSDIFILTSRNCRRNTSRHCRKSDKGVQATGRRPL